MMELETLNGKKVCVAVSGGVDSMALTHYLRANADRGGYTLLAVHCEHGIRGEESVADMQFVMQACEKWNIPLMVFRENCLQRAQAQKKSVETAAREFRYECFERVLQENKADVMALAHHAKDEAETVLFRLSRGTALGGAAGMHAEKRERFIRPFLDWSKERVLAYAQENGVEYREDITNTLLDATRNKIRLQVLPILEQAVPGAVENIARFAALAAEDEACLQEMSKTLLSKHTERGKQGVLVAFCRQKPLFYRAALSAIKGLGVEKDYTTLHLESAFALQEKERGAWVTLPKGVYAEKVENGVFFSVGKCEQTYSVAQERAFDWKDYDGGRYLVKVTRTPAVCDTESGLVTLRIDGDKLPIGARFRFRKDGDFIEKFGGSTKTIKKFFNEKKVPVDERAALPLIADEKGGEVYAVCGYEISEKVKVTEETKNVLYISIEKKI